MQPKAPYLQPVGAVMSLFGHHQGQFDLDVSYSGAIDAVASVTDKKVFLHVANTDMNSAQTLKFDLGTAQIASARAYVIAAKAETEITVDNPDCFAVKETAISGDSYILPPAAVAAIEIDLR